MPSIKWIVAHKKLEHELFNSCKYDKSMNIDKNEKKECLIIVIEHKIAKNYPWGKKWTII